MGRNHKIEIFMANNVSYGRCCPLFLVQNLGWNFSFAEAGRWEYLEKTPQSKVKNHQQTQPTSDTKSKN